MSIEEHLSSLAKHIITTEYPKVCYEECTFRFEPDIVTKRELEIGVGTRIDGMYLSIAKEIVFKYYFKPLHFFHEVFHHSQYLRDPMLLQYFQSKSIFETMEKRMEMEREAKELAWLWKRKYKKLLYNIPNIKEHFW